MNKVKSVILRIPFVNFLFIRSLIWYSKATLPLYRSVKLKEAISFFIKKVSSDNVSTQAASVAFNVFISIFPAFIFLFTLIPYLPFDGIEDEVLDFLWSFMPENAYFAIEGTLHDILSNKRGGLLSIGVITALYFASNSVSNLIDIFNSDMRISFFKQKITAILMTLMLGGIFLSYLLVLTLGEATIHFTVEHIKAMGVISKQMLFLLQWVLMLVLIFFAYSILYYFGDLKKIKIKYILPGAILATILTLFTSLGFAFYVNNFGDYNSLYGSLGALIITMLWLYYNAFIVIICYDFNLGIKSAIIK